MNFLLSAHHNGKRRSYSAPLGVLLALVFPGLAHAAGFRDELTLPAGWKVQPATANPEAPPDQEAWGQAPTGAWEPETVVKAAGWRTLDISRIHDCWFEQTVTVPADWSHHRLLLDFRRVEGDALVWVNGRRIGEVLRPGGEIDITNAVQCGAANVVRLFATRAYHGISRPFADDPLRLKLRGDMAGADKWGLGPTAPVRVLARPQTGAITDVLVIPSWREHSLTLDIEVDQTRTVTDAVLSAVVTDAGGREVLTLRGERTKLPAGKSRHRIKAAWNDPIPWELDGPYLYRVTPTLSYQTTAVDRTAPIRFGFREIWTEGRKLMMNGHPSRWRASWIPGGNIHGLSFLRAMNGNMFQIQPASAQWWKSGHETFIMDEAMLDRMDELGIGTSVPALSIRDLGADLIGDTSLQKAYRAEMEYYLRRYRNHPSILAWAVGMNTYNPKQAIHPEGLGRRANPPLEEKAQIIESAVKIVHAIDPTRIVYSHADGNLGDLATANVYLNFAPLQEREEWPTAWVKSGNMPFMAAEMGEPYIGNYWKGKQFLLTEYLAAYVGDRAYELEPTDGLQATIKTSLANLNGHGDYTVFKPNDYPAFWEFQRLFMTNTERAWRTFGTNGGRVYWIAVDSGWGDPPGFVGRNVFRYAALKAPVTERPDWATPFFDLCRDANQPLLCYIAGTPLATDKTHAFYAGEQIEKQIALVWDGPGGKTVEARWSLENADGLVVGQGVVHSDLKAGDVQLIPFSSRAPTVEWRTDLQLKLEVKSADAVIATDVFPLQVFPRPASPSVSGQIALWDPKKLSADAVAGAGINARPWRPGESLSDVQLLVIGREALHPGDAFPFDREFIAKGLNVLVLEQLPQTWEAMGFETTDLLSRYVFPRHPDRDLMAGLAPRDFINWRGSPNLLPEGRAARQSNVQHVPRWSNRHAVASTALRIPALSGVTPLFVTEFDLSYSPLLQWRYGRGTVWCSTFDFTGRSGFDPAATQLLRNLLQRGTRPDTGPRDVVYAGGPKGAVALAKIQTPATAYSPTDPQRKILVLGEPASGSPSHEELESFAHAGGRVLVLPRSAAELRREGFAVQEAERWRAPAAHASPTSTLAGIGAGLLRWRGALPADVFLPEQSAHDSRVLADGLILERQPGLGRITYLQVDPARFVEKHSKNFDEHTAVQTSIARIWQLHAQILTNLGAGVAPAVAHRLTTLAPLPIFEPLGHWQVLGPFPLQSEQIRASHLHEPAPGEASAISGDTNPNLTYKRRDGVALGWRTTVLAGADGFVDLRRTLALKNFTGALAFATRTVTSEIDCVATLRVGGDFYYMVWVNGKMVYETLKGHTPRPAESILKIPLHQGENVITFKVISGGANLGFWADLARTGTSGATAAAKISLASLYQPWVLDFDPYEFSYW